MDGIENARDVREVIATICKFTASEHYQYEDTVQEIDKIYACNSLLVKMAMTLDLGRSAAVWPPLSATCGGRLAALVSAWH